MKTGARAYTITDVEDLHNWMVGCFEEHRLFKRLNDDELAEDVIVPELDKCTEEGQKVARNGGKTFLAVFEKLEC